MSIRQGGSRPRWCAAGGIRGFGWSLLITITAKLTSTTLVVVEICLSRVRLTSALHLWHGASQLAFESVVTMRIQKYAGSRIKSGSGGKCSSGWHVISLCYSYNSRMSFSWQRASRGSLAIAEPLAFTLFIFIHQKTAEKKNNTKTIRSERKANNLTKQIKICKHFPIQFIIYSSINQLISNHN